MTICFCALKCQTLRLKEIKSKHLPSNLETK
jgi:hypothetical protein